eukprot:381186-Hanusia_phi.AAC.1
MRLAGEIAKYFHKLRGETDRAHNLVHLYSYAFTVKHQDSGGRCIIICKLQAARTQSDSFRVPVATLRTGGTVRKGRRAGQSDRTAQSWLGQPQPEGRAASVHRS